jgi:hypothetical protein
MTPTDTPSPDLIPTLRDWLAYRILFLLPISQATPRWAQWIVDRILPSAANWAYRKGPET